MHRYGVAALVLLLAGCAGKPAAAPTVPAWTAPPPVSAPAALEPDGTVPWVDEPAVLQEFVATSSPAPSPPPAVGEACRADQLRGELPRWIRKGQAREGKPDPILQASLYGFVNVTNTGTSSCTLQGNVDARLYGGGAEVALHYTNGVSEQARKRKIGVPAGGQANLRLDWSAPFCSSPDGPLTLRIKLPDSGGTVIATIGDPTRPGCVGGGDLHPEVTSTLATSVFEPGPASLPEALTVSPLAALKVSIGPDPLLARYVVVLSNPGDRPVALDGPIGFSQYLTSHGMAGVEPFAIARLYRLNRRVIREVPAHGSVRFAMVSPDLPQLRPGLAVTVNWILLAPGSGLDNSRASFDTTI